MNLNLNKFILALASLSIFCIAQPILAWDLSGDQSRPYWVQVRDALHVNNLDLAEALLNNPPVGEKYPLIKADATLLFEAEQGLSFSGNEEVHAKRILKMVQQALDLGLKVDAIFPGQPTPDSKASAIDSAIHLWIQSLSEGKINEKVLNDRLTRFLDILFSHANEYCSNHTLTVTYAGNKSFQYKILRTLLIQDPPLAIKNYFYKKIHYSVVQVEGLNFIQMLVYEGKLQELEHYLQLLGPEDARKAVNTLTQTSKPTPVIHFALMALHRDVSVETIKSILKFLLDNGANPYQGFNGKKLTLLDECDSLAAADSENAAKFQELKIYIKELLKNYPEQIFTHGDGSCHSKMVP